MNENDIPKYTFTMENRYKTQAPSKITLTVETERLEDVLDFFPQFLVACGFSKERVDETFK